MFRTCLSCLSQTSRTLASTSSATTSVSFHTAAVLHATRRQGQSAEKINIQRTRQRLEEEARNKPSVVLGTRSHEEKTVWPNCDLAKCLVNHENLTQPPPISSSDSARATETIDIPDLDVSISAPKDANYGVTAVEKQLLFEELPVLSASAPLSAAQSHFNALFDAGIIPRTTEELKYKHMEAVDTEKVKLESFAKVIDLQNANAGGIAFENRRRIILEFSGPENPFDPGRTEVQAALLTYQIRKLWSHLTTFKRDVGNRRPLLKLIHQRAKILKYLKRKNQDRYEALLPRLALDPMSVEGELVL